MKTMTGLEQLLRSMACPCQTIGPYIIGTLERVGIEEKASGKHMYGKGNQGQEREGSKLQ